MNVRADPAHLAESRLDGSANQSGKPLSRSSDWGKRLRVASSGAVRWLSVQLASPDSVEISHSRRAIALAASMIFLVALSVRLLHWQDSYVQTSQGWNGMSDIARHYKREAQNMRSEKRILFPRGQVDEGDARLILHPPGYSAFMATIYAVCGDSDSMVRLAQLICDSLSAVMVFLIAVELLRWPIAIIAALLVALSPHLAYYALWFSPDTLPVLPILVAVYLIIRASKHSRIVTIMAAGAMVGLSLWLRANALLLAPFLAAAAMLLIERGKRMRYAAAFLATTVLVISPITIRNWVLFHHLIPISIAGGENLVVGIADYDEEGRFGMPVSDGDVALKDAEWHNRPEYAKSAWLPDGVERDQARYARGLEVIRSNPGWFLGVMFKRAFFMLRYNDSSSSRYPLNTSLVPIVAAHPPLMHWPESIGEMQPVWSVSARELLADDSVVVEQGKIELNADGRMLQITGDASGYADQFASAPIAIEPKRDYVLTVQLDAQGPVAAKVTSADRRFTLASQILNGQEGEKNPKKKRKKKSSDDTAIDAAAPPRMKRVQMPFASGNRSDVRFVVSNNGPASAEPVAQVGQVELFDLGATPYQWTRYPRALVRGVQKNLFKTGTMLTLVIAGVLLLSLAGRGRALIVLLSVPAYYICAQSVLSTEYRYILPIHYFLFVLAAVTLYCFGAAIRRSARLLYGSIAGRRSLGSSPPPQVINSGPPV
jgi:Dolichyl-phosphate-mannose-protein mannosyltransferase